MEKIKGPGEGDINVYMEQQAREEFSIEQCTSISLCILVAAASSSVLH